MNKSVKKGLIALSICISAFIFVLAVSALTVHLIAACYTDGSTAPAEADGVSLRNWMSLVEDDALLTEVAIPGSHDAGCTDMMWAYRTQNTTIAEQLACGTRYFDLRVAYVEDTYRVFHGGKTGPLFEPIVESILAFLKENPSECLLLDFQHFFGEGTVSEDAAYRLVKEKLEGYAVHNTAGVSDLDFVKSLRLGDARGKCLVFWGSDHYATENWIFRRDNDEGTVPNSTLHSYYVSAYNKSSSAKYIEEYLPEYWRLYENSEGGFFDLQGQLTDGMLIFGPAVCEVQHDDNMNAYLRDMPAATQQKVNIVMRDYITPKKNVYTIACNLEKGNLRVGATAIVEEWLGMMD